MKGSWNSAGRENPPPKRTSRVRDRVYTRRAFMKSASSTFISAAVLGGTAGAHPSDGQTRTQRFILLPDERRGTYQILLGREPLVRNALVTIHTEDGTTLSSDPRFTQAFGEQPDQQSLTLTDRRGVYDLRIVSRNLDRGIALTVEITNRSRTALRVKDIFPVAATRATKGGIRFWDSPRDLHFLTDEWERCYGEAGVSSFARSEHIESPWDLHLFDQKRGRSLSIGYLQVPNARFFFSVKRQGSSDQADLVVRADTRAGSRGVVLGPGRTLALSDICFLVDEGTPHHALEMYAVDVARRNRVAAPARPPVGWVDWYFRYGESTDLDIMKNLEFLRRELRDFGLEYVQIDSGWQKGVETVPPPHNVIAGGPWVENSKFQKGMRWYADQIKARGFKPGLWIRPFQMVEGADERKRHPEWFNAEGQMDVSNPEVRQLVRRIVEKVVTDWGYEYLKYDFSSYDVYGEFGPNLEEESTAHPSPMDQEKTTVESYREALGEIRAATEGKAWTLSCNSMMPLSLGAASSFRIGDDVGDWERTVKYGVRSASARYYTNGILWSNDPDVLLVREPFSIGQAQMWASLIALSGGAVFVSENLPELPAERLDIIKKILPPYVNGDEPYGYGRPVDLLDEVPPSIWNLPVRTGFGAWNVIGVFNWGNEDMEKEIGFGSLGLPADAECLVYSFWEKRFLGRVRQRLALLIPPEECRLLSLRPVLGHPQLLSTDRHITQGGV
ncbi:MAG: glycoside hydrolase family 36 protein, partial [Bacteroidota bacterium]